MKKRVNRILSLLLLCVVMVTTAIPAYAAGVIDTDKNADLTISYQHGNDAIAGAKFDIYRVADVDAYAQMTLTNRFAGYPISLDGQDQSDWDLLATTLKGYVWTDSLTPDFSGETDENGNLTASVKPGLYLVVGYRRTLGDYTYSASPYLVFLPGSNQKQNTWDYAVTSYPKASPEKNPSDNPDDKLISRKVLKIWDDSGKESSRPKAITIRLLCDGKVFDTVTLNADNNWRYVWDNLERNHDWLVTEDAVSGYTQAVTQEGITFTVKNTVTPTEPTKPTNPTNPSNPTKPTNPTNSSSPASPSKSTLPQTGQLWWPVPFLFIVGFVCALVGLNRSKGVHCENEQKDSRESNHHE